MYVYVYAVRRCRRPNGKVSKEKKVTNAVYERALLHPKTKNKPKVKKWQKNNERVQKTHAKRKSKT